jgi:hypothetical protein
MKSLKTLRIPLLVGAFGAFFFFAPSSHAQECDPQHFDDSAPSAMLAKAQPAPKKASAKQVGLQSSNNSSKATLQPVASRQSQNGQNPAAVVPAKQTVKKPESEQQ